jgi:transketolase
MNDELRQQLQQQALDVRRDVIRMVGVAQSGHLASSLSLVDLLVFLYMWELDVDPSEPKCEGRDRFILGKRHGCPALYTVLAHRGFFRRDELWSYRRLGAMLQGHPEYGRTPGIDAPSGSPGLGLGLANGIALGLKLLEKPGRVFCLLGDGEMKEGSIWEAALTTASRKLGRVVAIVDCSLSDEDGRSREWKDPHRIAERFRAFGWETVFTDGHDFEAMEETFALCQAARETPLAVLARTRLGKGVPLVEKGWPHSGIAPGRHEMEQALRELNGEGDSDEDGRK